MRRVPRGRHIAFPLGEPSPSSTPFVDQSNDFLGGSRFPQAGKDSCRAVQMSVQMHVSHSVDRQGDVVSKFVRLARGRLNPDARSDARDHHLGDTQLLQVFIQTGVGESAPRLLVHRVVSGMLVQLRDEIGPSGWKTLCASRLFCSAGCAACYVDQYDGQVVAAKCARQGARVLDDFGGVAVRWATQRCLSADR